MNQIPAVAQVPAHATDDTVRAEDARLDLTEQMRRRGVMHISSVQFSGDWETTIFAQPQTVLLVPSAHGYQDAQKSFGLEYFYFESRSLPYLLHLIKPNARILLCSSFIINPCCIEYYLSLAATGPPNAKTKLPSFDDMQSRLGVISVDDHRDDLSLAQKISAQPSTVRRIRQLLQKDPFRGTEVVMHSYVATAAERYLASQIDVRMYTCPKECEDLGTKSGSRQIFRHLNLPHAPGTYDPVHTEEDLVDDLFRVLVEQCGVNTMDQVIEVDDLSRYFPSFRVVFKLNDGKDGLGNVMCLVDRVVSVCRDAIRDDETASMGEKIISLFRDRNDDTKILNFLADPTDTWERWVDAMRLVGIVIEVWLGDVISSPSVVGFCHSTYAQIFMTGDQILENEISWAGSVFPANAEYRQLLIEQGTLITQELSRRGVRENVGIDFVVAKSADGKLTAYCVELNVRWTGTTSCAHTFRMLLEKDGLCEYDVNEGGMRWIDGVSEPENRVLYLPQKLRKEQYIGLLPETVIEEIQQRKDLDWNPESCKGVVINLLASLSGFGRVGCFCVGEAEEEAKHFFEEFERLLDRLVAGH